MDRYCLSFDADPYPGLDPTTVSNCRADPDPDPTPSLKCWTNQKFFGLFFTTMPVYIVLSLVIVIGCVIIFSVLAKIVYLYVW